MRSLVIAIVLAVFVSSFGCTRSDVATPPRSGASAESAAAPASPDLKTLRLRAEKGEAEAQYALSLLYAKGEDAPVDIPQSVSWLRKAAEQGHPGALFDMGSLYAQGAGVEKDDGQAAAWFTKSAEQGTVAAQVIISGFYSQGRGVPQDDGVAAMWLRKAADQGAVDAELILGLMLAQGTKGGPRDAVEGLKWILVSHVRSTGEWAKRAEQVRLQVSRTMSASDVAEAKKRADDWLRAFQLRK